LNRRIVRYSHFPGVEVGRTDSLHFDGHKVDRSAGRDSAASRNSSSTGALANVAALPQRTNVDTMMLQEQVEA
jgi:hypothetical protein